MIAKTIFLNKLLNGHFYWRNSGFYVDGQQSYKYKSWERLWNFANHSKRLIQRKNKNSFECNLIVFILGISYLFSIDFLSKKVPLMIMNFLRTWLKKWDFAILEYRSSRWSNSVEEVANTLSENSLPWIETVFHQKFKQNKIVT